MNVTLHYSMCSPTIHLAYRYVYIMLMMLYNQSLHQRSFFHPAYYCILSMPEDPDMIFHEDRCFCCVVFYGVVSSVFY